MRSFIATFLGTALLSLIVVAILQVHTGISFAGEAPAWNPSDVPPWGTGPNPNLPPTPAPVLVVKPAPTVQPAPAVVSPPTGAEKFLLYKTDGSAPADVSDRVLVFVDPQTGSQFLVFTMPTPTGTVAMMVKR